MNKTDEVILAINDINEDGIRGVSIETTKRVIKVSTESNGTIINPGTWQVSCIGQVFDSISTVDYNRGYTHECNIEIVYHSATGQENSSRVSSIFSIVSEDNVVYTMESIVNTTKCVEEERLT